LAENGVRDQGDGLVLADHPFFEGGLKIKDLFAVAFFDARNRNPREFGHDFGDRFLIDDLIDEALALLGFSSKLLSFFSISGIVLYWSSEAFS
jgi:hypothetical protein